VSTFTYNPDGTARSIAYGNGVTMTTTFNEQNRLVNSAWSTPSGRFANSREISAGGNVSAETLEAPTGTSTFSYVHDSNGRLSQATVTAGLVPATRSWQWTFDDASNRLTQRVTTNGAENVDYTYAYNKASQLISTTDPAASGGITYDAQGNALTVGPDSFTYDKANNVVSATDGTVTVSYERDFAGAVIAKSTTGGPSAGTIRYSSTGVLLDADSKAYALTYSLDGGVNVTKALTPGAATRWQFTGINGDLFFTTDDAGAVQGSAQAFDPYGQVLTTPNAPQPTLPSTTWEAGTGNESESLKTPYQLMGARVYIPALGRFAQLDPKVGGSANGYDYVNQDPVNFSDPTGNESENWLITGVTGAVAFVVGALIAPARGALVGVLVGAIAGAALTGLSHAIEYAVKGQTEFSITRLGISILAGAVGGGIVGRVRWAKAQKTTVSDDLSDFSDLFSDTTSTASQRAERLNGLKVQGAPSQSAASGLVQKQAATASFKQTASLAQQNNMKLILVQSDSAGIKLRVSSKSFGDEPGVMARAASVRSSRNSGYSLAPNVRVSQQLDDLGFGYDF
jgi:RHS repeat-associated protein